MKLILALILLISSLFLLTSCGDSYNVTAEEQIAALSQAVNQARHEKETMKAEQQSLRDQVEKLQQALSTAQDERDTAEANASASDDGELQAYALQLESQLASIQAKHAEDLEKLRIAYEARCRDVGRKQPSLELGLRTYRNVTFRQFTESGIVIDHEGGMVNAAYEKLPQNLRDRYVFTPQVPETNLLPTGR